MRQRLSRRHDLCSCAGVLNCAATLLSASVTQQSAPPAAAGARCSSGESAGVQDGCTAAPECSRLLGGRGHGKRDGKEQKRKQEIKEVDE